MNVHVPKHFTVDEFFVWSQDQPKGKYELFDGKVVMQQAERWVHAKLKLRIGIALQSAIEKAGSRHFVAVDGPMIRIDASRAFQPDIVVAAYPEPDRNSLEIANPVTVIEILSPSTAKRDLADKLVGYFLVPTIQHYLVVDPDEETILWHRRSAGGGIEVPQTMTSGSLKLDPPGVELALAVVFPKS
jgi:Uma2 family endonuclease